MRRVPHNGHVTYPSPRNQAAARQAGVAASVAGAVDLSGLKARIEAEEAQARRIAAAESEGAARTATGLRAVVDVTEETFETEVLARSAQVPVVVDLWATWCGPCKQLSPVLERLAEEGDGRWVLAKIDVDANPRLAQAFGVQSVPTVIAVAAGRPIADFSGAQPEPQLRRWIEAVLDATDGKLDGPPMDDGAPVGESAGDPRFEAARQMLAEDDLVGAAAVLEAVLHSDPGNAEARSALLEVTVRSRIAARAADPRDPADVSPDDVDVRLAEADALFLGGDVEGCFERIVTAVRDSVGDGRARARARLLEFFEGFDAADPRVAAARTNLASALY